MNPRAQPAQANTELSGEILDQLFDAVYVVDSDRRIRLWNLAAEKLTGFSREEVVGRRCSDRVLMHVAEDGTSLCGSACPLRAILQDGQRRSAELHLHHKKGHRVSVEVRAGPLYDSDGNITGAIEIFGDSSSARSTRQRLAELEHLALVDELTQLPNRRFLQQRIDMRIAELDRLGAPFGVLLIDIDHFKGFNDTYGHDVGDEALQVVARTLTAVSRDCDNVGRWGGEEFVAVVSNVGRRDLAAVGERYRNLVAKSMVHHAEGTLSVTISVGGALAERGHASAEAIKRSDLCLYQSKANGRNQVTIHQRPADPVCAQVSGRDGGTAPIATAEKPS